MRKVVVISQDLYRSFGSNHPYSVPNFEQRKACNVDHKGTDVGCSVINVGYSLILMRCPVIDVSYLVINVDRKGAGIGYSVVNVGYSLILILYSVISIGC